MPGYVLRRHDAGLAPPQVIPVQDAAHARHIGGDLRRHVALVEVAQPGLGQVLHRVQQAAQLEESRAALVRRHRRQPVRQVDAGAFGIQPQHGGGIGHLERREPILRQPAPGQRQGRRHHLAQRQHPPASVHVGIARRGGGYREGKRSVDVRIPVHLRPGEQVGLGAARQAEQRWLQPPRRTRAKVHDVSPRLPGTVHHRESDAAQPTVPRLDRRKGERRSHRGVHGVAAGVQDRNAGQRRIPRLRHHHAPATGRRGLGDAPILCHARHRVPTWDMARRLVCHLHPRPVGPTLAPTQRMGQAAGWG